MEVPSRFLILNYQYEVISSCISMSIILVYMAVISLIFMLLLCWLYICFMTVAMYGSHHVSTNKLMNNVSMT